MNSLHKCFSFTNTSDMNSFASFKQEMLLKALGYQSKMKVRDKLHLSEVYKNRN